MKHYRVLVEDDDGLFTYGDSGQKYALLQDVNGDVIHIHAENKEDAMDNVRTLPFHWVKEDQRFGKCVILEDNR